MAVRDEVTAALQEIEPQLRQPTRGGMASVNLGEQIRAVRKLLAQYGDRWIGVAKAKRFLAVSSEDIVKEWARVGYLESHTLPNGRIQFSLDNVLWRREETEGLGAIDGDEPITTEEALHALRPAKYPPPAARADPAR